MTTLVGNQLHPQSSNGGLGGRGGGGGIGLDGCSFPQPQPSFLSLPRPSSQSLSRLSFLSLPRPSSQLLSRLSSRSLSRLFPQLPVCPSWQPQLPLMQEFPQPQLLFPLQQNKSKRIQIQLFMVSTPFFYRLCAWEESVPDFRRMRTVMMLSGFSPILDKDNCNCYIFSKKQGRFHTEEYALFL